MRHLDRFLVIMTCGDLPRLWTLERKCEGCELLVEALGGHRGPVCILVLGGSGKGADFPLGKRTPRLGRVKLSPGRVVGLRSCELQVWSQHTPWLPGQPPQQRAAHRAQTQCPAQKKVRLLSRGPMLHSSGDSYREARPATVPVLSLTQ